MAKRKKGDAPEGVTQSTPVEFEHPDTGQRYGGSYKAFTELYEPLGYELVARADGQPLGKEAEDTPESGPEPVFPEGESES